jgi:radical SAM protein with 4Fe4S-binding SPASM domain
MDWDLFQRIVDDVSRRTAEMVLHHRGESLLHPRIGDMIQYAHTRGLKTILHTNATLLNEEKSRTLLDAGLDLVSFSVDGWDRESYECVRVGSDFDLTVAQITDFLHRRASGAQHGPQVQIEVIDFVEGNSPGRRRIRETWRQRFSHDGPDRIVVKGPHNWGGVIASNRYGDAVCRQRCPVPCTFPWFSLTVFWNGDVVPCPHDFFGKLRIGSAREQSIAEIWRGKALRELRRQLVRSQCPCADCDMQRRRAITGIPLAAAREMIRRVLSKGQYCSVKGGRGSSRADLLVPDAARQEARPPNGGPGDEALTGPAPCHSG